MANNYETLNSGNPSPTWVKPLHVKSGTTLEFTGPFNKKVASDLILINNSRKRLAYKMKSNGPSIMRAFPTPGIIEPFQEVKIGVSLNPVTSRTDKVPPPITVMIHSVVLEDRNVDLTNVWTHTTWNNLMVDRLECLYNMRLPQPNDQDQVNHGNIGNDDQAQDNGTDNYNQNNDIWEYPSTHEVQNQDQEPGYWNSEPNQEVLDADTPQDGNWDNNQNQGDQGADVDWNVNQNQGSQEADGNWNDDQNQGNQEADGYWNDDQNQGNQGEENWDGNNPEAANEAVLNEGCGTFEALNPKSSGMSNLGFHANFFTPTAFAFCIFACILFIAFLVGVIAGAILI